MAVWKSTVTSTDRYLWQYRQLLVPAHPYQYQRINNILKGNKTNNIKNKPLWNSLHTSALSARLRPPSWSSSICEWSRAIASNPTRSWKQTVSPIWHSEINIINQMKPNQCIIFMQGLCLTLLKQKIHFLVPFLNQPTMTSGYQYIHLPIVFYFWTKPQIIYIILKHINRAMTSNQFPDRPE